MYERVYNVLFLSNDNSLRSILAEATLNQLGLGRFHAYSAGLSPSGVVNPLVLEVLEKKRIPTDGLRSKNWKVFSLPEAPRMDLIINFSARDIETLTPGRANASVSVNWKLMEVDQTHDDKKRMLKEISSSLNVISHQISSLISIPFEKFDHSSLRAMIQEIGISARSSDEICL